MNLKTEELRDFYSNHFSKKQFPVQKKISETDFYPEFDQLDERQLRVLLDSDEFARWRFGKAMQRFMDRFKEDLKKSTDAFQKAVNSLFKK